MSPYADAIRIKLGRVNLVVPVEITLHERGLYFLVSHGLSVIVHAHHGKLCNSHHAIRAAFSSTFQVDSTISIQIVRSKQFVRSV